MGSLLVVALCLGAGVLLRNRVDPAPLTTYLLYVALPALGLVSVGEGASSAWGVASVWLVFGASALVFAALGRWLRWDRATVGCLTLCCGLSNTSFVGFPLLEALIGPEALPVALPLDQLGSFLLVCTLAPIVAARAAGQAWSPRALVGRAVRFPALWAVLLGLLLPAGTLPAPLVDALHRIGATLSPVALFVVGAGLRLPQRASVAPLTTGLVWKLAFAPLLVLAWVRFGHVSGLPARVAVLEGAMAPMVTGALIARAYDLRPELAGALLGVGVPLSLLTVWGWDVYLR